MSNKKCILLVKGTGGDVEYVIFQMLHSYSKSEIRIIKSILSLTSLLEVQKDLVSTD